MFTWHDLWNELDDEANRSSEPAEALAGKHKISADAMFLAENEQREIIDEACRQYIATGKWPLSDPTQAILMYARLSYAADFAQFLAFPGREAIGERDLLPHREKALEFLLVDCWNFAGRWKWIAGIYLRDRSQSDS